MPKYNPGQLFGDLGFNAQVQDLQRQQIAGLNALAQQAQPVPLGMQRIPDLPSKSTKTKEVKPVKMPRGKLLHTEKHKGRLYGTHSMILSGFPGCCSAVVLHGVNCSGYKPEQVWKNPDSYSIKQWKYVDTIHEYAKHYGMLGLYRVPEYYAYLAILEQVLFKARDGNGGSNMHGGPTYPTKTIFIADRDKRGSSGISSYSFMHWLHAQGPTMLGRCYISPFSPGGHGGQCKGAVYAMNCDGAALMIHEAVKDLNLHAAAITEKYGSPKSGKPIDAIAGLW